MEKSGHLSKHGIRSKYLNDRSNLSKSIRADKSRRIIEKMKQTAEFQKAEVVLVYMDYRCEVETTAFVDELLKTHEKRVFAPKVEGLDVAFYEITSMEELFDGYQGIREPETSEEKKFNGELEKNAKCLVVVPGAVFDRQMGRMGYGKGFYDRFLNNYPNLYKMAIAFECQIAKKIPVEEHDIRMNMIVTENGIMQAE